MSLSEIFIKQQKLKALHGALELVTGIKPEYRIIACIENITNEKYLDYRIERISEQIKRESL